MKRRRRIFITFFSIVLTVYAAINLHIFIKGINALPENNIIVIYYSVLFISLASIYIIGRVLERRSLNSFTSFLVRTGGIWLGAMVYFFLIVILIDLASLINLIFGIIPEEIYYSSDIKIYLFISIFIIVLTITLAGYVNAKRVQVKEILINLKKQGGKLKNFRIAMASDIHLGTIVTKKRLNKIVELLNAANADIVLLPGDVIDEDIKPVIKENLGELLRNIKSKNGVYAVTGNHEYIGGADKAVKYLTEHGIKMISDACVLIDDSFYIAGREDRSIKYFKRQNRKELKNILEGADRNLPVILMDHQPLKLNEAAESDVDLQLSGHTHHGQLWPFNFITKKIYEISMGYRKIGNTHYYVSCGAGTWGPPIRTGNRPEVVYIDVRVMDK